MTKQSEDKIMECPFCGKENVEIRTCVTGGEREYYVTCVDCVSLGPNGYSGDEAVLYWNRRMPSDEISGKIRRCPFCGGKKIKVRRGLFDSNNYWMSCRGCDTHGPRGDNREEAVKCWNERSTKNKSDEITDKQNRVDVCLFRTKTRGTNMMVFNIVKDYLKKNKLDGLVNYELSCACSLDDLEPCGHMTSDCMPGKFNELRGHGDVFIDPVHIDSE